MVEFNKEADTLSEGFNIPTSRLDDLMQSINGQQIMSAIDTALNLPEASVSERLVMLISIGFSFGQMQIRRQIREQEEREAFQNLQVQ